MRYDTQPLNEAEIVETEHGPPAVDPANSAAAGL
jgi:hypothetical protein